MSGIVRNHPASSRLRAGGFETLVDGKKQQHELNDLPVKRIHANGRDFHYVEDGRGEPVVFVHEALGDLRTWLDQIERLGGRYRAISYSRRSHWPAAETRVDQAYTRDLHAADLAALQNPELVSGLILGEPSPFLGLFDLPELDLISKQKVGFDEARLLAKRGSAEAAIRQFLNVIVGTDVLDQLPELARTIVIDNAHSLTPMLEHYFESPPISREMWKRLKAPALLMSGEFSPKIAGVGNTKLHECLPESRPHIVRSASHYLHIENPIEFNQVLTGFLEVVSPN